MDAEFGARQFAMNWDPADGHTAYWNGDYRSNPARQGIAAIVTNTLSAVS